MRKSLLLAAAAAALLVACGPRKVSESPSAQDFSPYIKAYTGGIVADDAIIRVDVTDIPDEAAVPANLFTVKPPVSGTMTRSGNSFCFVPDPGALKAGKSYSVSFDTGKLFGKDAPQSFDFGLAVRGKENAAEEAEARGQGFYVRRAQLLQDRVEVLMSRTPAHAWAAPLDGPSRRIGMILPSKPGSRLRRGLSRTRGERATSPSPRATLLYAQKAKLSTISSRFPALSM